MDAVIALNNQAAMLIENGVYGPSILILKKTLVFLLDGSVHATADDNDVGRSVATAKCTSESAATKVNLSLDEQSGISKTTGTQKRLNLTDETDERKDDEDFVYISPLHHHQNAHGDTDTNDVEAACELNCILLFNTALAYHLWALENYGKQPNLRRLKKALQFYELSFSMQLDVGILSITHILALVNNCASIYRLIDRPRRARRYFQHMTTTLMAMIEAGEASEVEQLDGFLHNACRQILQDVAAPAA
jgi:hypothetical protein